METLRKDTRSQWRLMISFDLINEKKIEVRHRMYWLSQVEPSMALPGQKLKTFGNGKKNTNNRTDRRRHQFKFRTCTMT